MATSTADGLQNNEKINSNGIENDISFASPQIFVEQLFKLYDEGLIGDDNIRDQVFLMVRQYATFLATPAMH